MYPSIIKRIKENWKSGLAVALVSIPLSVSLAVASHASPVMGILTAIFAGITASLLGGSDFNVVGPTGALSGILAVYAVSYGQEKLPMLAILAGVLIMAAYIFRLDRYLVFVPGSAIHGFTLGVAFIIGMNQLNFALGLSGLASHEQFIQNLTESLRHADSTSPLAVAVFLTSLALLFAFKKFFPRFPGAIALAPLGILLGFIQPADWMGTALPTLGSVYPDIALRLFLPYQFSFASFMLMPALAIALVAILETMISAKIADTMTGTKYDRPKEMRGLAAANIVSGLMGGMPATAALARTSLNIKTEASDNVSAAISSVAIALISGLFLAYFKFIPLAVIAAILVFVALQMVEVCHFHRMFLHDRKNFYTSLIVAFVTVYIDPMTGILWGVGISSLFLIEKLSRGQFDLVSNSAEGITGRISGEKLEEMLEHSNTIVYSIKGLLCYVNSEAHIKRFESKMKGAKNIILRLRSVYYIDLDGVEAIDEIIRIVEEQGKTIVITSVSPIIAELLKESSAYRKLAAEGRVFPKSAEALQFFGFPVR